jgi:hypothetical protein
VSFPGQSELVQLSLAKLCADAVDWWEALPSTTGAIGQDTLRASTTAERHRWIVRGILRALMLACLCSPAAAAPPENPDPRFTPWYKSLRQPGTGAECCGLADCRIVEFRRNGESYEVFVDDRWRLTRPYWARVPPEKILERPDNPTGRAVVCFTPEAGVMCFILPPQS